MKGEQLGYILHSDMTVSSTVQSGKTPIGVVVCSYAGGGGQAMALNYVNNGENYKWSTESVNVPGLQNYSSDREGYLDTASCNNTTKIRAAGDSSTYPAAWAAYNYTTEGTKVGDWCLPAAGVYTTIIMNETKINKGFNLVGGKQLGSSVHDWMSTAYDRERPWHYMDGYDLGMAATYYKTNLNKVRPVIEF